jgi:hypothetical protein
LTKRFEYPRIGCRDEFVRKKVDGHEMITTRAIIEQEQAIMDGVRAGMGKKEGLATESGYQTPAELKVSYASLARIIEEARVKGEEMTAELATLWPQQHEAVNRHVMTSSDQFLNIRGGASVGKTYFMERLGRASLDAGRPVVPVAPYRRTKPGDAADGSGDSKARGGGPGLCRGGYCRLAPEQGAVQRGVPGILERPCFAVLDEI